MTKAPKTVEPKKPPKLNFKSFGANLHETAAFVQGHVNTLAAHAEAYKTDNPDTVKAVLTHLQRAEAFLTIAAQDLKTIK